jgi:CIC family chloride channel protein
VLVALAASGFVWLLREVQQLMGRLPGPKWLRPGLGGLLLSLFAVPIVTILGPRIGERGQGFGIFGGGYGAAQIAISGSTWLGENWRGAGLLLLLALVKIVATSFTVGSGGSAGDFGPSLVIGGLVGGAYGRAAQLVFHDPRIDPGAFALVGMGTFYGGIAHTPLSALVMVCELAGSYDLLVPLMLAEGIAFVALRKQSLYPAQVPTRRDSAAHRPELIHHALEGIRVSDVMVTGRPHVTFQRGTRASEVIRRVAGSVWQDVFPVLDEKDAMVGIINAEVVRTLAADRDLELVTVAQDIMEPPASVSPVDELHTAIEVMLRNNLRELPVTEAEGRIIGFLDEAEITRAYMAALPHGDSMSSSDDLTTPGTKAG